MKIKPQIQQRNPELWASISRIFACLVIYIYHYASLYGKNLSPIDFFAILIFVFLSGYFAFGGQPSSHKQQVVWLLKRIKATMIPYWPVISLVIFFNELYQYKSTGFFEYLVIFFGGSMFLDNPLYVVAWFITLILGFYFYIFLVRLSGKHIVKYLVFACGFAISLLFHKMFYFLAFNAGYIYKSKIFVDVVFKKSNAYRKLNAVMFEIQNYCYSFFLLHGGVLLFSINVLKLSSAICFIVSFVLTVIGSVILFKVSQHFQKISLFSIGKTNNANIN